MAASEPGPGSITGIEERRGNVLESNTPESSRVISERGKCHYEQPADWSCARTRGTGRSADIGRPSAGKTSFTNDHTNVWYVGYTPEHGLLSGSATTAKANP